MARRSASPVPILSTVALLCAALWWLNPRPDALVVYCAHDAEFSEPILQEFERRTGIPLNIQFDTEATKSLSLIQRIRSEKAHPRCDLFWNNETLGTIDLAEEGLLESYSGPGYDRIPKNYKDPEARWTGFAARLRVVIYNKNLIGSEEIPSTETDLLRMIRNAPQRFSMAKPMYGTTLTQYAAWWNEWGGDQLKEWHHEQIAGGLQEVSGNATSKDLVANGHCRAGFTDTDDFHVASASGYPVGMVPVRLKNGSTICIPNTIGIVKGSRRLESARKLADYLLSEEVELRLSKSPSRQIPLGAINAEELPQSVRDLTDEAATGTDLRLLSAARRECLNWLQEESLQ